MSKPECRESRVVPFDPRGVVWAAAIVAEEEGGLHESSDVDGQGRLLPSPLRPLPYQAQRPPGTLGGDGGNSGCASRVWATAPPPRPPLAAVNGNGGDGGGGGGGGDVVTEALGREIRALELERARMAKRLKVQDQLIRGFCKLVVTGADGPPG